jgi:hypothetical protein
VAKSTPKRSLSSPIASQVIQRSSFKSLLPEDMHGAIKRLFRIEATRPSYALWQFAYHDSLSLPYYLVIAKQVATWTN